MKSTKCTVLGPLLTSYLLGCITFYVFLCFTGVVTAFLMDHGVHSFIFHKFIKPLPQGEIRQLLFATFIHLPQLAVNALIVFLFTFLISKYLIKKSLVNSVIITIGAMTADLYYFIKMPFDSSFFLSESYKIDIFNLMTWFICTIAAVKLAYLLRAMRGNKDAQQALGA